MLIDVVTPGLPSACDKLVAHFSSFYRLKVATTWLLRFKAYLLNRVRGLESCVNFGSPITFDELEVAAAELVKYMQRRSFSEWFTKFEGSRVSDKLFKASGLYQLNPILVEEILRVGGHLASAKLPFEIKHPVILPSKHNLTDLIVHSCHSDESGHQDVNVTLNNLMKRFWMVNPKVTVKRMIKQCLRAKKEKPNMKFRSLLTCHQLGYRCLMLHFPTLEWTILVHIALSNGEMK